MKKEKVMIFSTKLAVNFEDIQKNKRAIIVDNFYKDPDAVREYALQQEFFEGDAFVGRRTNQQFLFPGQFSINYWIKNYKVGRVWHEWQIPT